MARIRTIKPEFPQSESVGRLSRDARLLFIMLWTIVDDAGRSRASSRMLASLLYPYDDDARDLIGGWLSELETEGMIRRYEIDGSQYLDIPKWLEHQKIDHASQSKLPEFRETLAKPREALAPDLGPRTIVPKKVLSETSSDPQPFEVKSEGKKRQAYSDDFDAFWKAYPTDKLMSKKEAAAAWSRLSAEDRVSATKAVPAFKAHCAKDATYRPLHAVRFLSQRRFDGFAETDETPRSSDTRVYIKSGTDAWDAWVDHWRATKGKTPPQDTRGGWYFPTEFPPHTNSEAA